MDRMASILIVDDEQAVRRALRKALAHERPHLAEARSGEEALQLLARHPFDLVLTDIRMREVSGLDLLAEIKNRWPDTAVILLTGYASLESAIQALRQGAHDYLVKPASLHEVRASVREGLARRREALRRRGLLDQLREGILELSQGQPPVRTQPENPPGEQWQVEDWIVDRMSRSVTVGGAPVELTAIEFQLFLCLLKQRGRVLSYQEAVRQVYGYECDRLEARQLIMSHVSHLRQKLRAGPDSPNPIKNVRGVGYILAFDQAKT